MKSSAHKLAFSLQQILDSLSFAVHFEFSRKAGVGSVSPLLAQRILRPEGVRGSVLVVCPGAPSKLSGLHLLFAGNR